MSKERLESAIQAGDVNEVERLLILDPTLVYTKNKAEKTPIHLAASEGRWEIVKCIVQHGQNNAYDKAAFGAALVYALKADKEDIAIELQEKQADLTWYVDNSFNYAIHWAVQNRCYQILPSLARTAKNRGLKNGNVQMALDLGISLGDLDAVKLLLTAGASITTKNPQEKTPIQVAAFEGHWKIVEYITEHGQNNTNDDAAFGAALVRATKDAREDIAIKLFKKNAPITWTWGDDKNYAIHWAVQNRCYGLLALLADTEKTLRLKNDKGQTVLDLAICLGDLTLLQFLIERGNFAEIQTISPEHHHWLKNALPNGKTPLMLAMELLIDESKKVALNNDKINHFKQIIQYLLKSGARDEAAHALSQENNQADICEWIEDYQRMDEIYLVRFGVLLEKVQQLTSPSEKGTQILKTIINRVERLDLTALNSDQKLDLYACVISLLKCFENAADEEKLIHNIKSFFAQREDAIVWSSRDYCYSDSLANQLCINVANIIRPLESTEDHYDIVLHEAKTAGRSEEQMWQDFIEGTSNLPLAREKIFRLSDNTINFYDLVLNQACVNLKDHQHDLERIWYRSDYKGAKTSEKNQIGNEALPLERHEILFLKQRSPTFATLVDYTLRIDTASKKGLFDDVYSKFVQLRDGLNEGSRNRDRVHSEIAGPAGHIAVCEFGEWWRNLDESIKNRINAIKITSQYNNFGRLIVSILGDVTCTDAKQSMLTQFLDSPDLKNNFQKPTTGLLDDKIIDAWHAKIIEELEEPMPSMLIDRFVDTPKFYQYCLSFEEQLDYEKLSELETVSRLIGTLSIHSKKVAINARHDDLEKLIDYVLKQNDNTLLELLINELKKSDYNYLREATDQRNRFYGYFFNPEMNQIMRTPTNQDYATFERVLSKKLLLNNAEKYTSTLTTTNDSTLITQTNELCMRFKFIENMRSSFNGPLQKKSSTAMMFQSRPKQDLRLLRDEITELQQKYSLN